MISDKSAHQNMHSNRSYRGPNNRHHSRCQFPKMVFVWPLKAYIARIAIADFLAGWFRCQRNKIGGYRPSG